MERNAAKGDQFNFKINVKLTTYTPELDHVVSGRMLYVGLINAANKMLYKQFPDVWGLRSPVVNDSLSFRETESPLVQKLHVGSIHWMTAVIDNTLVVVNDSLSHHDQ